MTTTTHQTIKSIRSEAASKIAAIRAERDAAIEAIRVARAEAVAAKQAEEAKEKARAEYREAVNAEFKPFFNNFYSALYPQGQKGMAFTFVAGLVSTLNAAELRQFKSDFKKIVSNPCYIYNFDCEAYELNSQGPRLNVTFRNEEQREEYRQAHMSYFEKNGITLDLPEEQFQFVWDTYVQYCNENNYPIDLVNEYGLGSIFDLEYICDVEPSRKEAFIEWAWPMQEAEDKAYEEYLSQEGEE